MPRPWSQERKKRLSALKAAGRSNTEIAEALGLSREVVVERLQNLKAWERNKAIIEEGFRKRAESRQARAQKAIADMAKAIARGASRNQAMLKAYEAGAVWREIGEHFGITAAAACHAGGLARPRGKGRVPPRKPARKRRAAGR